MLHRRLFLLCSFTALLLCGACTGPRGFWKLNRTDRNGLAKGRWRTYYDAAEKEPFTTGQYRHGRPVRTFRYYSPTGTLDHTERYGREGFCEVIYWHPNGTVARRGHAQWLTGAKGARFYWFGPWTSYAEDGQKTAINTYTDGKLSRAEIYQDGQLIRVDTFDKWGQRIGTTKTL